MIKKILEFKKFFLFIIFLSLWIFLLSQIDIDFILNRLSANSSYILVFFVALFGGVSVFTSSSYLATLVVLSLGPANPFLLAISAGLALTLGDSLFYYFGTHGRKSLPKNLNKKFNKISIWMSRQPRFLIKGLIYVYTGFTPLPADLLMLFISFSSYPLKKVIVPLFAGNITLVLIIYYTVKRGVDFLG